MASVSTIASREKRFRIFGDNILNYRIGSVNGWNNVDDFYVDEKIEAKNA